MRSARPREQRPGRARSAPRRSSRPRRPGRAPSPATTTCTPCVVESVSATCSAGTPICCGEQRPHALAALEHRVEVRLARRARSRPPSCAARPSRRASAREAGRRCRHSDRRAARAPESARARRPSSSDVDLHGRVIRQEAAVVHALSSGQRRTARRRAAHEDVVDARAGCENPHSARSGRAACGERSAVTLKSPARTTTSSGRAVDDANHAARSSSASASRRSADSSCSACSRPGYVLPSPSAAAPPGRFAAPSPRRDARRAPDRAARLRVAEAARVQRQHRWSSSRSRGP